MSFTGPQLAIRTLALDDVEVADAILNAAFGFSRDTRLELRRYLALEPQGWFLALVADQPAGMVGALNYGTYAYIGMMGVHPRFQRRGIGRALMKQILRWLNQERCPLVLLDASPFGAPLYVQLGFTDWDLIHVFVPRGDFEPSRISATVRPMTSVDLPLVAALDRKIYHADRSALIRSYFQDHPDRAFVALTPSENVEGYLIAQTQRIGPWVSASPAAASDLLVAALTLPFTQPVTVLCPATNQAGRAILEQSQFHISRSLRHMKLGPGDIPIQRTAVYSQASFTTG